MQLSRTLTTAVLAVLFAVPSASQGASSESSAGDEGRIPAADTIGAASQRAGEALSAELQVHLATHGVSTVDELYAKAVELGTAVHPSSRSAGGRRKAMTLFRVLAEHGHIDAQVQLAHALLSGSDAASNVAEAVRLLQAAAEDGQDEAQQMLGVLHSIGAGVELSVPLAITHYHFAAEAGNTHAQLALGYRHLHGVDVPKVCARAVMYYNPVAEKAVAAAQRSGGRGLLIEKTRLTEGPARAGRKLLGDDDDVIQYYQYSAEKGSVDAQLTLGQLNFHGARGLPQDPQAALSYYRRAAEAGEAAAHSQIGHMYAQGIGVEQDNATALKHFQLGAAKGHPASQNGLGYMYMHGYGVEVSYKKALEHFRAAADKGNPEAQFNLGAMYIGGMGVKRAYDKALHYFTLAAHQGHTLALYNLGQMHLNGLGTQQSCSVAVQFLKAVAERGEWTAALERAHRAFAHDGDSAPALLLYAQLAEGGIEVAQANAAHVIDSAIRRGALASELPFLSQPEQTALEMYSRSAQQGNVDAQIKLGDYHYYGRGTKADPEQAVAHYRLASEGQNAEAMFNLAYMHAHGLGLPRDFHLAKRHYDMAIESTAEAFIPVKLALCELYAMQWLEDVSQWRVVQMVRDSSAFQQFLSLVVIDEEIQWDTVAIMLLTLMLGAVVAARFSMRPPPALAPHARQ